MKAITAGVEAQVGLAPKQPRGRGRTRYGAWCRCLVAKLGAGILGYRAKKLAKCLESSSVSVGCWLSEGKQLHLINPGSLDRLSELKKFAEACNGRPIRRRGDRLTSRTKRDLVPKDGLPLFTLK